MKNYHEAWKVSLHDEHIYLYAEGYPDADTGWKEYGDEGTKVSVNGEALENIFQTLDVDTKKYMKTSYNRKNENYETHYHSLDEGIHPPLFETLISEPDSSQFNVEKIFVNIRAQQLLDLRLFISSECSDEHGVSKTWFRFIDISYSGNFTVWLRKDNYREIEKDTSEITPEVVNAVFSELSYDFM